MRWTRRMLRAARVVSTTRERTRKRGPPTPTSLPMRTTAVTLEESKRAIALCSRTYWSRQVTISTTAGPTTGRMTEEVCAKIAARAEFILDMAYKTVGPGRKRTYGFFG